jgi:hypothetical protein
VRLFFDIEMSTDNANDDNVIRLEPAAAQLRHEFLGWQCRIRQLAVRELAGRPTPGMRPRVTSVAGAEISPGIVVLLNKAAPADSIKLFRHQVLKTFDPIERYDKALEIMAASYFQRPDEFSDVLTALFGPDSALADRLVAESRCILEFNQFGQRYRLPCAVARCAEDDEAFQATYWHNRLYNDAMPAGVQVVSFTPDWARAAGQRDG